ncbi:isochorismatase family protein [Capillimicrobium parvum]|uniref:Maleamate amidohydrolase n=1 Tax=Capillimicrobium parvum TaxID=2884022 RepID=A0A9E7C001_9ACTN|nr:isochorismatase family protein [Capillimicrobium parvum]UGS35910.1 Maleamate amidohydrolase [Capillimicrobium parvum]
MSDEQARQVYAAARLGQSFELGSRPAVLVVDLTCGFTDPSYPVGSDLTAEIEATNRLLGVAREQGAPVIFTTIGYEPGGTDAGVWPQKFPAILDLQIGDRTSEIDPRLQRRAGEPVVLKKGASAFFGTNLSAILVALHIDTVVLCGATTSGCIRATAIDLLQHGFPALVPRECVGDRARAPHEANLFDIQAKYADVVSVDDAIAYLESVTTRAEAVG